MSELKKWILNELDLGPKSKIKKIVAIYPGRFQPMGAHHAKTYKWLAKQFGENNTFVATSDKVELPKSPFNFNEKKKIINSHGIKNVVQVKNPYLADEVLKKYDPETTAVVFMYGAKDAGRLRTTKKDGSPAYYQPYDKNKNKLQGYTEHGYFVIAPHVSMKVPGFGEMSGTEIRKALGGNVENKDKIFKGIFGHNKKDIYDLVVGKLQKLSGVMENFTNTVNLTTLLSESSTTATETTVGGRGGTDVDDGPRYFYGHRQAYETLTKKQAERLGFEVVDWILSNTETMDFRNPYPSGPVQAVSYFPSGVPGEKTPTNQVDYKGTKAYREWQKHIKRVAGRLGMQFVNWLDSEESKDKKIKEPNKVDKQPNIAESVISEASPLDKTLRWKDKETGETKTGTARSVIRTGNPDHPAWDDAERLKQQDETDKESETEKEKERSKAEREKEKEKADKKDKAGEPEKPKGTPLTATDFQLPQEKEPEVGFEPGEDLPSKTSFKASKELIAKAKERLKKLSDSEKQMFREIPEKKRSIGQAILNKAKSIPKALKETFKHKVHVYKDTAKATGKLFKGEKLDKHDKSALKQFAIDVAIVSGMVASGGIGTGVSGFAGAVAKNLATMWVKDISVLGIGRAALFAGKENPTEDEMLTKAAEHFGTWLQTKKLSPDDYLSFLVDDKPTKVEEGSLPTKVSDDYDEVGTEDDKFAQHHKTSAYAPMGSHAEEETYDWDDGSSTPGHQATSKKARKTQRGYEPVRETFSKDWWKPIMEEISLPIEIGDTVYMGKFKNKPVKVTDISWNEKGDLLINGKSAMRMRIPNKSNVFGDDERYTNENVLPGGKGDNVKISESKQKYYHTTSVKLPNSFVVKQNVSAKTKAAMLDDYGIEDFPGGLFVSELPEYSKLYGKYTYEVEAREEPPMLDWGKYIFPNGTRVKVKLVSINESFQNNYKSGLESLRNAINKGEGGMSSMDAAKLYYQNALKMGVSKKVIDNPTRLKLNRHNKQLSKLGTPTKQTLLAGIDIVLDSLTEGLLLEGGAYGHMNHPFDDANLKFADLKRMIDLGLQGKLDVEQSVTEKTDGQNLMVTWKDGKLKAARNKSTLIDPMDINAVKSKFAGRGDIEKAFVYAMKDLQNAIGKLSDKQRDKIFKGGKAFMNLEIIYPATENVIVYDTAVIQFHGAIEYDDKGNMIGPVADSGRMLQGMIAQVNADVQNNFKIIKPQVLSIKPHNDYTKKREYFFAKLKKLQKEFNLKDQDTLGLYHQMWWESFIRKQANKTNYIVPNNVMEGLIRRWAFWDKGYSVNNMKKDIKDQKFLDWVIAYDKTDHSSQVKDNMYPFETLIFEVGTEILHNVENYLTASPDKAIQKIKDEVHAVAKDIEKGGDINKITKLKKQLARIEAAGGLDKVVPSEGIVFVYGGKTYKITGTFGPVNAILGTLKFAR